MIGKLKGRIDSTGTDWVMIDVGGVCYFAAASAKTLNHLPRVGEAAELHTETKINLIRSGKREFSILIEELLTSWNKKHGTKHSTAK